MGGMHQRRVEQGREPLGQRMRADVPGDMARELGAVESQAAIGGRHVVAGVLADQHEAAAPAAVAHRNGLELVADRTGDRRHG